MNHMDIIRKYCRNIKLELSYGGNSNSRIHMVDRCIGGNLLEIPLSKSEDEFADEQLYCWKIVVVVMVKRARYDFEQSWRWEPGEVYHGSVGFHHWDYDELLKRVAEWLVEHEDHKTGLVTAWGDKHKRGDILVPAIKCDPIGNLKHYTTMEKFKDA